MSLADTLALAFFVVYFVSTLLDCLLQALHARMSVADENIYVDVPLHSVLIIDVTEGNVKLKQQTGTAIILS